MEANDGEIGHVEDFFVGDAGRCFSSMSFRLLILKTGIPHAMRVFHLVAIVVTGSIIVHSSTDVPVARWFHEEQGQRSNPPRTE